MDVTDDAAPTTPDITFRTCVLLQWYSAPSMLLIEPVVYMYTRMRGRVCVREMKNWGRFFLFAFKKNGLSSLLEETKTIKKEKKQKHMNYFFFLLIVSHKCQNITLSVVEKFNILPSFANCSAIERHIK